MWRVRGRTQVKVDISVRGILSGFVLGLLIPRKGDGKCVEMMQSIMD